MTPESPSYSDRKFPCPHCSKQMVLTPEEHSAGSFICPYCKESGPVGERPAATAEPKKSRTREKPYRALDDPVFRTFAPKAALKHDINNMIAEVAEDVAKEAWHGIKSWFTKGKKKPK